MKLAVCLYKYFAFGGLARDFRRIMEIRRDARDEIDIYYIEWHGDTISGFKQIPVKVSGWTNHGRMCDFHNKIQPMLKAGQYDLVIGFNKMPGLDLYYAADPCYLARVSQHTSYVVRRHFGRVKFYEAAERAVFGRESQTVSMMISEPQKQLFKKFYQTPDNRLIDLPPGIDPDRRRSSDWHQRREKLRNNYKLHPDDILLLMVGTGFKTKGVDRAINAVANLPDSISERCKLFIIGEDKLGAWRRLAKKVAVSEKVLFLGGRPDVPDFLLGADLLLHPARKDNTGTVILEAIVAGLPVLVTDVCGYAHHVKASSAGELIEDADNAHQFSTQIAAMLAPAKLEEFSTNALIYANTKDLYSMPQQAADLIKEMAENNRRNYH